MKHIIGKHTVTNANLMHLDIKKDLLQGNTVEVMYYRYVGQEVTAVNLDTFLNKLFEIARDCVTEVVFIEYGGDRYRNLIFDFGIKYELHHVDVIELQYMRGRKSLPLDLHIFAKHPFTKLSKGYIKAVRFSEGYNTLKQAVTPFIKKGLSILDPRCGLSYTAQFAVNNELIFYGNEQNSKRLESTIYRLEKDKNK